MRTWTRISGFKMALLAGGALSVASAVGAEQPSVVDAHGSLSDAEEARLTPEEYRRFLDGLAQARPIPMPDVDPALIRPGTDPGQLITFEPGTGQPRLLDAAAGTDPPRRWPGFPGSPLEAPPEDGGDGLDVPGGPRECTPPDQECGTHTLPWRTVVKLLMRFNVGGTDYYYVGSAATVSSFHLMTAGHCLFNWDPNDDGSTADRKWADEVWAWPAQTDLVPPFGPAAIGAPVEQDYPWGVARSAALTSYTGWTQMQDLNHDMGYIRLDRRIGDRVGWMGAETDLEASSLNFDGYPAETPYVPAGVICPYPGYDAGNVTSYTTTRINMCAYVYGGHSGGPVWRYNGTNRYIQGVNSTSNRVGSATATRLTSGKFSDLYDTIIPNDEASHPPTARPDLIEYVLDLNAKDVLDNSVPQGDPIEIEYNLYNVGFASTATITVDLYLSANTNITTGDYLLGTVILGSLGATAWTNPTVTRNIPCSVPVGTYYVGYIFECMATEYNTDNNVVVISDETVSVTTGLPANVTLVAPADGAICQPTSLWLDWTVAARASSYDLQIGTSCGSGATYTTTASSYTVSGLANDTIYYWRVRGTNDCGDGAWSSCRTFRTTPGLLAAPALQSPPNGATCQESSGVLDWADVSGADQYRVQYGTSCGSGPEYLVTSSQHAYSGLTPGVTYYWRVATKNACDEWGTYSSCRSFTTAPPLLAAPVLQTPANGQAGVGTAGTLDWSDVAGATGYRVRLGTSCGSGTAYEVTASQYAFSGLAPGTTYHWQVRTKNSCDAYGSYSGCFSFTTAAAGGQFVRGDDDANGEINIGDPICNLAYQFAGGPAPSCLDAADTDDSGEINISDPIYNLAYQFSGGPQPPAPNPECGADPTADGLACGSFPPCGSAFAAVAPPARTAGERIELRAERDGADVAVAVTLTGPCALAGLEFTVAYDSAALQYAGVGPAPGRSFDFLSGKTEEGAVRVGCVPDLEMQAPLVADRQTVAIVRFRVLDPVKASEQQLRVTGGLMVGADLRVSSLPASRGVVSTSLRTPALESGRMWAVVPSPYRVNTPIVFAPGLAQEAELAVYDVQGRRIRMLLSGAVGSAPQSLRWDGRSDGGVEVANGLYYLRVRAAAQEITRKFLLMR